MAKGVTDDRHYISIADAIREKIDTATTYKPEEMANGVNDAYNAGIENGTKYLWDILTDNGTRKTYERFFFYSNFEEINPPYKLILQSSYGGGMYMFAYNKKLKRVGDIFDFKNSIECKYMFSNCTSLEEINIKDFKVGRFESMFYKCEKLKTITNLTFSSLYYDSSGYAFHYCYELENVGFAGVIRAPINLSYSSKLTIESLKSLITHLFNWAEQGTTKTYTLTLHSASKALLEAEGATSPNGNTWAEYIADLGWTLA